jgi:hypothetical protein
MIKPKPIQTNSRIQVPNGKEAISAKQTRMPIMGTKGTHGVRKERGALGSLFRNSRMPVHTIMKANKVPMETISPSFPMGKSPANSAQTMPVMIVVI